MAYAYKVTTPQNLDVHLTTDRHHTTFAKIEDFLAAHQATIRIALNVTRVGVQGRGYICNMGAVGQS